MWKKSDSEPQQRPAADVAKPRAARSGAQGAAVIGKSIVIDGDLSGGEDLTIHGRVKGQIKLPEHTLRIGAEGRIEARASARRIQVDGRVDGDLTAQQEIIIHRTGDVRGNLVAPRIGLEEGAKFRGSIDMEPDTGGSKRGDQQHAQQEKRDTNAASASENKATG